MQETNVIVKKIPKPWKQNYDNGFINPAIIYVDFNLLFIISAMCIQKFETK